MSIIIGYDAVTLREKVDLRAAGDRLDELGELRSLSALNEKVALLRLLGRLDEAMEIANTAVRQARFTGDRQELAASRIRRAQVLQFQGKLDEAALELGHCINESEAHEWNGVAALARETRGKVHFEQGNFDDYQMLRLDAMPEIETHLALTGGDKWGGIGEPGVPPLAPALGNAIFKITGKRVRSLPLSNHDLNWS